MNLRRFIAPVVTLVVLGGAATAAYFTRDSWMGYVFPTPKPKQEEAKGEGDEHHHDDEVTLSPQAQKNLKLDIGPVTPRAYWRTLLVPGMVVDRPGESDRSVTARLSGIVTKVIAKPGDTVRGGQPLFTLQLVSENLQATQRELATASKELAIATADRDRVAKRVAEQVSPASTLVEPENKVKRATTLVNGLRRQLEGFGLTSKQIDQAETGEFVTDITVAAPVPADAPPPGDSLADKLTASVFEVQELKVNLGETVQAGQALCVLASHQRLFVEGRAFKSEAGVLAKLAEQQVGVKAEFADEVRGEWPEQPPLVVHHLSNVVDPSTRTFAFYLTLNNHPRTFERDGRTQFVWRYRPGQRVRLRVPVEKLGDAVLVLPAAAVVREGAEAFAFVQNGDRFERKGVRVLYEDRTETVVENDGSLPAGAVVVKNQATALNRALKAAQTEGGGHGHDHEH